MILSHPRIHGLLKAKGLSPHPIVKTCEACQKVFETRKLTQRFCTSPCKNRMARLNQATGQLSEYGRFKATMAPCPWGCVREDGTPIWGPKDLLDAHRQADHPEVQA